MTIQGHEIGKALIDALGLPKQAISFVLRVQSGRVVTVECEYCPVDGNGIVKALAEYELVRRPSAADQDEAPVCFDTWMRKRTDAAHAAFMERRCT